MTPSFLTEPSFQMVSSDKHQYKGKLSKDLLELSTLTHPSSSCSRYCWPPSLMPTRSPCPTAAPWPRLVLYHILLEFTTASVHPFPRLQSFLPSSMEPTAPVHPVVMSKSFRPSRCSRSSRGQTRSPGCGWSPSSWPPSSPRHPTHFRHPPCQC